MKKKNLWSLFLLMGVLIGCGDKTTLMIENQTMMVGETKEVTYTLNPTGLFAQTSLELVSETTTGLLEITGMSLRALKEGVATLKGIAENMPGASTTFKATKNFTVTINPIVAPEGDFIKNGGFEFGLNEWTFDPAYEYETSAPDNVPHTGEFMLNLWFDEDGDEVSEDMDMTLSQEVSSLPIGTYLLALWYKGTATSITLSIFDGDTELVFEEFNGYEYRQVPEHEGYAQFGLEFTQATVITIKVVIHVLGISGFWGFIDDITLKVGTIDDLILPPANPETGYVNHIPNGAFVDGEGWSVQITGTLGAGEGVNFNSGKMRIWTKGPATLKISRIITLTSETYNMCIYLNGGVAGSSEYSALHSYAYVGTGEAMQTLAITPTGWGDGTLVRTEKSNLQLSGEIEIGVFIQFDGGTNNWIDLDDFTLWSYNIQ